MFTTSEKPSVLKVVRPSQSNVSFPMALYIVAESGSVGRAKKKQSGTEIESKENKQSPAKIRRPRSDSLPGWSP